MYTDPNDQSVWMYHRWLVGTGNDIPTLQLQTLLRMVLQMEVRLSQSERLQRFRNCWMSNQTADVSGMNLLHNKQSDCVNKGCMESLEWLCSRRQLYIVPANSAASCIVHVHFAKDQVCSLTPIITHGPFKSLLKGFYSSNSFTASEFSAKQQT